MTENRMLIICKQVIFHLGVSNNNSHYFITYLFCAWLAQTTNYKTPCHKCSEGGARELCNVWQISLVPDSPTDRVPDRVPDRVSGFVWFPTALPVCRRDTYGHLDICFHTGLIIDGWAMLLKYCFRCNILVRTCVVTNNSFLFNSNT